MPCQTRIATWAMPSLHRLNRPCAQAARSAIQHAAQQAALNFLIKDYAQVLKHPVRVCPMLDRMHGPTQSLESDACP
jgi:hypothetical protein